MRGTHDLLCCWLGLLLVGCAGAAKTPPLPLASGQYVFQHRFAEHPNLASIQLMAQIEGNQITLINQDRFDVFPRGVIKQGTLTWHAPSGQWMIVEQADEVNAPEVGGCSDGPEVVDLQNKVYWTC